MKSLLYSIDNDINNEYILNKMNEFCIEKISSSKCQKFYAKLKGEDDGVYTCPYGFNCVKRNSHIYNCLLIKNNYNHSKIKTKKGKEQNVFDEKTLFDLIDLKDAFQKKNNDYDSSFNNISDFLHDITKVNSLIGQKSKGISKSNLVKKDKAKLESVIHLSDFITKRTDLYRYVSNPELITTGRKRETNAYKLWDIYRYIFTEIGHNLGISIDMKVFNTNEEEITEASTTFFANDSVSIIPFLLIDNAIKYSSQNSIIRVNFFEEKGFLKKIIVSSTPSYAIIEDPNIFLNRGYRSPNNTSKSSGSGLGLNIVKQICDYNNISINLSLGVDENGKQEFIVNMQINNNGKI